MNAVDAAIAAAEQQASKVAPATGTDIIEVSKTASGSFAMTQAAPMSLSDFATGTMNVDEWLKVKEFGMLIGSKEGFVQEFEALIDMSELTPFYGVRFGNPATYYKSFDKVSCVQGGTWQDAVGRAMRADSQCKGEYLGLDLQMTVLNDIVLNGVTLLEEGKRLGHSTSVTNRDAAAAFIKEVQKANLMNETVRVKVSYEKKVNPKGKWGIIILTLVGKFDPPSVEE